MREEKERNFTDRDKNNDILSTFEVKKNGWYDDDRNKNSAKCGLRIEVIKPQQIYPTDPSTHKA